MKNELSNIRGPAKFFAIGLTLSILASTSWADQPGSCYVSGDTSGSEAKKALGSKHNPYASLAAVQADASCQVINVLYSANALDGGILLKDGQ